MSFCTCIGFKFVWVFCIWNVLLDRTVNSLFFFVRSLIQLFTAWKLGPGVAFYFFGCTLSGPTWNLLFLLLELGPGVVPNFFALHFLDLLEISFLTSWHLDMVSLAIRSENIFCCLETRTWTFKSITYYFQVLSESHSSSFWTIAPEQLTCDQSEKVQIRGSATKI